MKCEGHLTPLKLFVVVAGIFLLFGESLANKDEKQKLSDELVQTKNGPVQGVIKSSRDPSVEFVSFMGLRYVKQPARFEPAEPLESTWSTPKVANIPGNHCPQLGEVGKWALKEDCLFLNVHVPKSHLEEKSSSKKLPVMVWIHGGGFAFGDGTNYGAEYIMETEDVILVTINYRLGMFGFITMETDTAFTANNGLRDCVMALKWVQENIAAFKGDPDKVTVAGNSAGSAIIHYLLMSPLATGLFHGAIMQSGAHSFWSYAPNPRKDALQLAKLAGCADSEEPEDVRKCLAEKPISSLLIGQQAFAPRWPPNSPLSRFTPTAKEPQDNAFFTSEPSSFFTTHGRATKYVNKVPIIAGLVRDEGSTIFTSFALADDALITQLDTDWDRVAPKTFCYEGFFADRRLPWISKRLREYYFGKAALTKDSIEFLSSLYSDSLFLLPTMEAVADMSKSGMKVWPYVFSYLSDWSIRNAFKLPDVPGTVGHGDELQYLFTHPLLATPLKSDSDAEKFSKKLVKFWTSFVKNGEPAQEWFEGEPLNWKPATINNAKDAPLANFDMLRINSDPKVINTFEYTDRLEFWRETLKKAAGAGSKNKQKSEEKQKTEL